jgi:hypothetical protein
MSSCVPLTAPLADVRTSQCFVKSCYCASTNYPLPASLYNALCAQKLSVATRVVSVLPRSPSAVWKHASRTI